MTDTNKNVLIAGGAVAALYLLLPSATKDQLQGMISDAMGGLGSGMGDLFGGDGAGGDVFNIFGEDGGVGQMLQDLIDSLTSGGDLIPDDFSDIVDDIMPEGGGFLSLPDWTKNLSEASTYQDMVARAGGIYGRQLGAEFLIGKHIIKPLPGASMARKAGQTAKLGAKVVQISGATKAVGLITKVSPKTGALITTKVVPKVAAITGAKLAPKVAITAAKVGSKAGLRAIPVVGWGLLLVDVGADIARLFGVDVTEWLGISALAEPVLGYNPLEQWVSETGGSLFGTQTVSAQMESGYGFQAQGGGPRIVGRVPDTGPPRGYAKYVALGRVEAMRTTTGEMPKTLGLLGRVIRG